MKIGVSSYSFAQQKKDPADLVALAKGMGFAAIEYIDMDRETALRVREASEREGLPVVCYAVGADFLARDCEAEAQRLFAQVEIAEILGVKQLRHDATRGFPPPQAACNSFGQALPTLAKGCRMVTEYAQAKGIATMVENHGFFLQDSPRVAALVGAVNHPNFGVLADLGNFLCADEDPARAVGTLAPMVKHVHVKDFHTKPGTADNPGEGWFQSRSGNYLRGAIVGHGEVPVRQCLRILSQAGYEGYVSIEFEGMEDCLTALRLGKDFLSRAN